MSALGVLTVVVKDGCLIGDSPLIYSAFIHLEIFEVHFDCIGSQNLVGRAVLCRCVDFVAGAVLFGQGGGLRRALFSWQAQ